MTNPFEIRLNVLRLAENILSTKSQILTNPVSFNKGGLVDNINPIYSADDVIQEANKLLQFVNTRSS